VTAPDGGETTYYFGGSDWKQNLVHRIDAPNGNVTKREWKQNSVFCFSGSCSGTSYGQNTYVERETMTLGDSYGNPAVTAVTDFTYDKNGNLTSKTEYDWVSYNPSGIETPTTIKRKTEFVYYVDTDDATEVDIEDDDGYWNYDGYYIDPHLPRRLNALYRKTIKDGSGNPVAATEYYYDDEHTSGNVEAEYRWDSEKS